MAGEDFFAQVGIIARQEGSIFFKIEAADELITPAGLLGIKSDSLQPRKTTVLDLKKTAQELLSRMHEKTRYNIRLAEKHGLEIKIFQHPSSSARSDLFWGFILKTAKRANFNPHVRSYYEKLFQTNSADFSNELFLAEFKGEVLAMVLINFYRPAMLATYLHGASVREHKEVMASYLLHWRVMEEAKKGGFNFYDFWGIDEVKWPGVTRFKFGFGGDVVEYPPAVDIIYKPAWYKIYRLAKKFRT
jgi:lipid II:glycine glycyltransferase (peptidoglycan interpeptide bridge formation enzyme)